jgi:hypothetical protein
MVFVPYFDQMVVLRFKELCHSLGIILKEAVGANMAPKVMVLSQEVESYWSSEGANLVGGSKFVKEKLLELQKDHLHEQAALVQQRELLNSLSRQALQAASVGNAKAWGPQGGGFSLPPPPQQTGGSRPNSRSGSPGRVHNVCDSWRKTGSCSRGSDCRFAASHVPR